MSVLDVEPNDALHNLLSELPRFSVHGPLGRRLATPSSDIDTSELDSDQAATARDRTSADADWLQESRSG